VCHQVCWHYCDDGTWKDLLVVFGGSSGSGLLNDTWLWDVSTSTWTEVSWSAFRLEVVVDNNGNGSGSIAR
jgi:hypothetical protein